MLNPPEDPKFEACTIRSGRLEEIESWGSWKTAGCICHGSTPTLIGTSLNELLLLSAFIKHVALQFAALTGCLDGGPMQPLSRLTMLNVNSHLTGQDPD